MLYKRKGYPEEHELVLVTITKIQYHSVFVNLDEYDMSGMIHISEVSPGRIRNIRDFVKEGKKVVCKVLRVNKERNQIDLSLRRVSDNARKEKVNRLKQEQLAEKIIETYAKNAKTDFKALYKKIHSLVSKDYDYIYDFFEEAVSDPGLIKKLDLDKKAQEALLELIQMRIKPPHVEISGGMSITSYESDGVEKVKAALIKGEKSGDGVTITYLGAGKFSLRVEASDYKTAEKTLTKVTDTVSSNIKKNHGEFSFTRHDK